MTALALQVVNAPLTKPDPPISSYGELLCPASLHLRLMPLCDASCEYCEVATVRAGEKEKEKPFPPELWEAMKSRGWLDQVKGIEVAGLGEPTLSKLWGTVAKDVLAAGKVFYAPTNGHWLNLPHVYEPLGDGTNVRLSISLDAGTPETYVKIGRGKNEKQWWDTLAAIKTFQEKCPKAVLHSQMTVSQLNVDDMKAWMQVCANLGIKETIVRFVQNVGLTAKEDISLRFDKDRTEAAIYEAQLVAEASGIDFKVERRPYATGAAANSAGDNSPLAKLSRYLDFAPMNITNCPGGNCVTNTAGGTYINTYPGVPAADSTIVTVIIGSTSISCTGKPGFCITTTSSFTEFSTAYSGGGVPLYGSNSAGYSNLSCVLRTTLGTTVITCTSTAVSDMTDLVPLSVTALTSVCVTHSYPCIQPPIAGGAADFVGTDGHVYPGQRQFFVSVTCNGTCSTTDSTCFDTYTDPASHFGDGHVYSHHIKNANPSDCAAPTADGQPEIIRSVKIPRKPAAADAHTEFAAESLEKPVVITDEASAIVWDNGDITSCFAKHVIGNVLTDTWESILKNPRWQAFLHNRQFGNDTTENWCANCPRNF